MSDFVITAENCHWGEITRNFEKGIEKFVEKSLANIDAMKATVDHYGINGTDELAVGIRDSLNEKLNQMRNNVDNLNRLVPELEKAAKVYDKALEKYLESL